METEQITRHTPPARLSLFGFPATPADVEVVYRPRSWRLTRALLAIGIAVGVAPVMALVPPHVPWPLLALGVGGFLAVRRWTERYTLCSLTGHCPRCERAQTLDSPRKLGVPHALSCDGCGHDLLLEVDLAGVPTEAATMDG